MKTEKNSVLFHFQEWNFIHENVSCLVHHFREWNLIHENNEGPGRTHFHE